MSGTSRDRLFAALDKAKAARGTGEDRAEVIDRGMSPSPLPPVTVVSIQPDPVPNDHPAVWDLVMDDMRARDAKGQATYGTRLQPHNGRDALRDAYEEALDLAAYLRQALYERDGR